jgi:hypothetical protein
MFYESGIFGNGRVGKKHTTVTLECHDHEMGLFSENWGGIYPTKALNSVISQYIDLKGYLVI